MAFDWAATKTLARSAVHSVFGVAASYQDTTLDAPVTSYVDPVTGLTMPLTARWHDRLGTFQGGDGSEFAVTMEGIERLVFSVAQLAAANLTLRRNGTVILLEYGLTFTLDQRNQSDGPVEVVWVAVRQ
jgi:hypothetical protein